VAAYSFVGSGTHDLAFRNYFCYRAVSDWILVAGLAAVILFLILIQAVYASIRIFRCADPTAKAVDRRLSERGFRSAPDSRDRSAALTRPGSRSGTPRPPRVLPVPNGYGFPRLLAGLLRPVVYHGAFGSAPY